MRKQITVPEQINEIVRKFAEFADVSESCIFSYAITCLCKRFNDCHQNWKKETKLREHIKEQFYKQYFIKELPRGRAKIRPDSLYKSFMFDDSISVDDIRRAYLNGENLDLDFLSDNSILNIGG